MLYLTFHQAVNNVWAYDDQGNQTATALLATPTCAPAVAELRGILFGPNGYLYVANGYKQANQVLVYTASGGTDGSYNFIGVYADATVTAGLAHPFAIAFDADNNGYISSQDTNVVTGVSPPATGQNCDAIPAPPAYTKASPLQIASYLTAGYPGTFLPGTFVASAYGALNGVSPAPPNVPAPQGLQVSPPTGPAANSVRDVVVYNGSLYVADEPGNAVKIYDLQTGQLSGQITTANNVDLVGPVHLLLNGDHLYIGSEGNGSVLEYDLTAGTLKQRLSDLNSLSGMAFNSHGEFYFGDRKAQVIYTCTTGKSWGTPTVFIPAYHKHNAPQGLQDSPEFLLYLPDPA